MNPWKRFDSSALNGDIQANDPYRQLLHGQVTRDNFDIISRATWRRNLWVGGGTVTCTTSGDKEIPHWTPVEILNDGGFLTSFVDALGGALLKIRFRYRVRVSDPSLTVTPKLLYGTDLDDITAIATVPTITGQSACSADDLDWSGTGQYQKIDVTLPGGGIDSIWKPLLTASGSPGSGLFAEVDVWHDLYIKFV